MMTATKEIGACKLVDLSKLFVSKFNARIQNEESLKGEAFEWLCNSIESEGLIEPLVVRPIDDRFEIVAGTRRFAALKHIGAKEAPTVVREMTDNDVRIASLVENIHRMDLNEDEKESILKEIYLTSWDEWKPADFEKTYYDTDENKIKLAKSYLNRIHNEATGSANFSKVSRHRAPQNTQQVYPTKAFVNLSGRVGYAASTQINILRGYGAFSARKDFYDELIPTIQELVDKAAKEAKLREDEKQNLARRLLTSQKHKRTPRKKPKTKKQKATVIIERFKKEKVRREHKQKRQKQYQQQQQQQQQKTSYKITKTQPVLKTPDTVDSPANIRGDILGLGHKLFGFLTGQKLEGSDIEFNESVAKNTQAIENMRQLTTFFASANEIAAQQHVIIPLNIAITKYRDILYEAVEAQNLKKDLGGR